MPKVRIKVRPSGLINGREWPEVGETIDLPASAAEAMAEVGDVEIIKASAPDKPAKVEKRPAARKAVETRKG